MKAIILRACLTNYKTDMTASMPPSERTRVRRIAQNADYERATLYAIIDAAYLCHLAFADAKKTRRSCSHKPLYR